MSVDSAKDKKKQKKKPRVRSHRAVFLFGILGMGEGPSELGKSAREIWKLGKVEMCLKP